MGLYFDFCVPKAPKPFELMISPIAAFKTASCD